MLLLNPEVPLEHPETHSCLLLPNQASQEYQISGKEIEVHSSARLLFLIQNVILVVGQWESCIL